MQTIDIGKHNSAALRRHPWTRINLNIRKPQFQAPIEKKEQTYNP